MKGMPRHDHAVFGEMHDLIDLRHSPIDVAELYNWAVIESCGAVVVFSGTVRDHADGRSNVTSLTYEAYEEPARSRMAEIAAEMRRRWPDLGASQWSIVSDNSTLVTRPSSWSSAHRTAPPRSKPLVLRLTH